MGGLWITLNKKVKKSFYLRKHNATIKLQDNNRLDKEESCKKVNWLIIIIYNRQIWS